MILKDIQNFFCSYLTEVSYIHIYIYIHTKTQESRYGTVPDVQKGTLEEDHGDGIELGLVLVNEMLQLAPSIISKAQLFF